MPFYPNWKVFGTLETPTYRANRAIRAKNFRILPLLSMDYSKLSLTLFLPGGGDFTPPSTYRQFSPDVLIRGGFKYTLNSSFVITEHIKLVPGQKNFPTPRERPLKSAG